MCKTIVYYSNLYLYSSVRVICFLCENDYVILHLLVQSAKKNSCEIDLCENGVHNECTA